jgi:hypothetical protein
MPIYFEPKVTQVEQNETVETDHESQIVAAITEGNRLNVEAINALRKALTKTGNKVVKAVIVRDDDNLITAITMQVTAE